jgi:6-phosphogluconolactonase
MTAEVIVQETAALQGRLAAEFEKVARSAIARRGACVVAIPGGSVATTFFPALSNTGVDWSRTDFFWTDERGVPPEDPESNYALASKLWLTPARVPPSRIHRMHGEERDLEAAARAAAQELVEVAGDPPQLDVALLGVGEDGHVASIFAGHEISQGFVAPVYEAPKPPSRRLTLTLSVLANAGRVIVAALGPSKAAVIRDALELNDRATPLAALLGRSPGPLILLDRSAAMLLKTQRTLS